MRRVDELKKRLEGLPRDALAAFAARAALRALPLLVHTTKLNKRADAFSYWAKQKRGAFLLAVLKANAAAILSALGQRSAALHAAPATARDAGRAITLPRGAYALRASLIAQASAAAAIVVYMGEHPEEAASFVASSHPISLTGGDLIDEYFDEQIEADIGLLRASVLSPSQILELPLWTSSAPPDWIAALHRFRSDVLSLRADFEIWLDWYDGLLTGHSIGLPFIEIAFQIPHEIEAQGAKAINAYMIALRDRTATRPLNRVRAIFIGYGDAGKTSLIKVLHNEPVPEGKEPMTPGIEIREWPIPGTDIRAHFWDFGGQVMVHATHQLFLRSACLYVLVISARSEINATEQAEYWLEHVKSFGGNSPVLIVGNRAEQADLNLDMGSLAEKYSNIVGYFPVSCTLAQGAYLSHANAFRDAFCKQLQLLTTHQMMFSDAQSQVLHRLQALTPKQSFLTKSDFDTLCDRCKINISGAQDRTWLLDVLDKLGVIIHFPQLPFAGGYVLNPRWLTYGVYKLMYAKQPRLSFNEVVRLLSQEKVVDEVGNELRYPEEKCRLIMDAMHAFKLSYPLRQQKDAIIIPALLPAEQPQFLFDKGNSLAFEFAFSVFLPRHVLPEVIVSRHQEIWDEKVWQTGVLLSHNTLDAKGLLTVDYQSRKLLLWVSGVDAREYLTLLRDEVERALQGLVVDYKELITLPSEARIGSRPWSGPPSEKASYRQVLANAAVGTAEFISESGQVYEVAKILQRFISHAKQLKEINQHFYGNVENLINAAESNMGDKNITITGSTIHGDVTIAESIENSFKRLHESHVNDDAKVLLSRLLSEIDALQKNATPSQHSDIIDIATDTQGLINEAASPEANKPRLMRKLNRVLETAKSIGEVGKSVVETASLLIPLFNS